MNTHYNYPIDTDWSTEEVIDVVHFFNLIEQAYEHGVSKERLLQAYNRFKEIVPSKSEEKQHFKTFQQSSGYSSYHAVQAARKTEADKVRMQAAND
ncbi:UPF0223 protein [Lentibacillus sp. JNUCC-1]|uniref:UPF0223 family protein n=1 Tax=Lentibacillus sp. JNUCC-1 TaxID=2654513 RepID=UPI0012E7F37C|nr:UPF0223 family protein [Lentibacillus sp. JNUCC-1]MUV36266.1 UPF0223 protein [Lentibacillus sp. JNUCC-1]